MTWQLRIAAASASLDLTGLCSVAALVDGAPLRRLGARVGRVRDPVLLGRELFATAAIEEAAFAAQLQAWEARGHLAQAVALSIVGSREMTPATECEPSWTFTAVTAMEIVDVPRGSGCFLWSDDGTAPGAGVMPSLGAPASRPWTPHPAHRDDPLEALRRRFARCAPSGRNR